MPSGLMTAKKIFELYQKLCSLEDGLRAKLNLYLMLFDRLE